jgi:hypothetical protein
MQSLTVTARVDNAFTVRASGRFESEVAPLIEAAPDLLAALVLLLNVERAALLGVQSPGLQGLDVPYHFEAARAAIARATSQA